MSQPRPARLLAPLLKPWSEADTAAALDPTVAVGTGIDTFPLIESATLESWAKPTDGGSYRKTEYTFFCTRNRQTNQFRIFEEKGRKRTKNVSPTIQLGAEPLVVISKNAPRQVSLVSLVNSKSVGMMVQLLLPPKLSETVTLVSQAVLNQVVSKKPLRRWKQANSRYV